MLDIDSSNVEALQLLVRPFIEDLKDGWKYVRALCVAALVITIVVWFFSYMANAERFARAKRVLNISGWFTFIVFVFTYGALVLEIYYQAKARREEKIRKIREF